MIGKRQRAPAAMLALALCGSARASGLLGIDHALAPDDSGVWARRYTLGLEYGVVAVDVAAAAWYGADSEPGKTYWQSADAIIAGQIAAQAAKYAFGRERPSQTSDPNQWFHGLRAQSFPSGEVTLQASFVTPFVIADAGHNPWMLALELLPAYDAAARVREGAHWQSDVLAGWALGTGFGYLAAERSEPFFLTLLPHGFGVGIRSRF